MFEKYSKEGNAMTKEEAAQVIKDSIAGRYKNLTEQELEELVDMLGSTPKDEKIEKEKVLNMYIRTSQRQ